MADAGGQSHWEGTKSLTLCAYPACPPHKVEAEVVRK